MFTIVAGDDTDVDQATEIADEIAGCTETDVQVALVRSFTDNSGDASIDQVGAARRARKRLEDRGIDVTYEKRSGDPVDVIPRVGDASDAGPTCIAGRKRSPTGKVVSECVTQDVILGTDRSVLVRSAVEDTIDAD